MTGAKRIWTAIAGAIVMCLGSYATSAGAHPTRQAMVVEPVIDLRRGPHAGSPATRKAHAGDIVDLLDEYTVDAKHRPEWQRIVVGPRLDDVGVADTLWAPFPALVSWGDVAGSLRVDLSLLERTPGVLGRRIGAREFLENPAGIGDSCWVSATYGMQASSELFTSIARLYRPGSYFNEGRDRERSSRLYDSLYATTGYRAIAHLESDGRFAGARLRIFLARRLRAKNDHQTQCVPLADTTLAVNGYECDVTRLIPRDALWGHPAGKVIFDMDLVFVAEIRGTEFPLGRLVQRLHIYTPAPE